MDHRMRPTAYAAALTLCLALCLTLCLGLSPAMSDPALPIASVGEITYGATPKPGAANCTGTLVAADLVLTAAHCLPANTQITFAAGQDLSSARATVTGHPEPLPPTAANATTDPVTDLALLRLDHPIAADLVQPLPLTTAIKPSSQFTLIAYRRDAPHSASINSFCRLVQFNAPSLGLTCAVTSGNSGAPLLVLENGAWHIAAVMVAQNRSAGPLRSFAMMPDADILAKITAP